ncbi:MAG: hypothetical protein UH687_07915 [Bacteroidaceae bacterium]|nr:hypothetical protein [Bacteroidaceae bacterium]
MKKTIIFTLLILLALGASAQRKRRVKTPPPPTPEELAEMARQENYERKLQVTERVTFIDSMLLKKEEVMDMLYLGNENGSIASYAKFFNVKEKDTLDCTLFRSQLGDKIIYAQPDPAAVLHLYASEMIGQKWCEPVLLLGLEDTVSHNYPFMLADGTTLYYASKSKEGLGGYDIYMTRWDSDTQRFFKPENIGMPFNSAANDYLYLVDEFNQLGWFVTDRGQGGDTVCVYCFIPNETRRIYDTSTMGRDTLVALANINSIRDTWTDQERVKDALNRLDILRTKSKKSAQSQFHFIVNDRITYTNLSQFRNEESRKLANKWLKLVDERNKASEQLEELRKQYSVSRPEKKAELAASILAFEQKYEKLIADVRSMEKEIRIFEQR